MKLKTMLERALKEVVELFEFCTTVAGAYNVIYDVLVFSYFKIITLMTNALTLRSQIRCQSV